MATILIVEDERDLVAALEFNLRKEGHAVASVGRGDLAVAAALRERPDLILLDVMLPGLGGFDVCRALRTNGVEVPVIMLTARGEEIDRVLGLEIGADDYVTKPFSLRELFARINVRLRRTPAAVSAPRGHCEFGSVTVDFDAHQAVRGGQAVDLSSKELDLLRLLVRHRGKVMTRERLLSDVWGFEQAPNTRTVDQHVFKLRQKLENDPANPRHILSIYGEGYKFVG
jgi:two-component system alkaline phosphatase synthesis response regulator PhoP